MRNAITFIETKPHAIDCDMDEDCSCGASEVKRKKMAARILKKPAPQLAKMVRAIADRIEQQGVNEGQIEMKPVVRKGRRLLIVSAKFEIPAVPNRFDTADGD